VREQPTLKKRGITWYFNGTTERGPPRSKITHWYKLSTTRRVGRGNDPTKGRQGGGGEMADVGDCQGQKETGGGRGGGGPRNDRIQRATPATVESSKPREQLGGGSIEMWWLWEKVEREWGSPF